MLIHTPIVKKYIITVLAFFIFSPVFANLYEFDFLACSINLDYSDTSLISIGVIDKRSSVLSGERKPDFAGIVRGGYGNPFYAATKSGKPFVEDINQLLCNTYGRKGYKIETTNVKYDDSKEGSIEKLKASGCKYKLLLIINEWKTDRVMSFSSNWLDLDYDFELIILDSAGNIKAQKKVAEKKLAIGKNAKLVTTKKFIESQALSTFSFYIGNLLNDAEVVAILEDPLMDSQQKTELHKAFVVDELIKLKKLLDDHVITEVEYNVLMKKLVEN